MRALRGPSASLLIAGFQDPKASSALELRRLFSFMDVATA
jgi:hypothetical protein